MKKLYKILALVLVFALCLCLLAACAKSEKTPADEKPSEDAPAATTPETPSTPDAPAETPDEPDEPSTPSTPDEPDDEPEEIVEIRFVMMGFNANYDTTVASDVINAITEESIGVHVDIDLWDMGTYGTQLTMEIAGGSQIDLAGMVAMPPVNFNNMVSTGQLLALNDYLAQDYCQDVSRVLADYLPACTVNGNIYAIPTYRPYCTNQYFYGRTEVLEELGLLDRFVALDNWGDFKAVMETIRDNTDYYPIGSTVSNTALYCGNNLMAGISTGGRFADEVVYDNLGDPNDFIMADGNYQISIAYDHPAMIEMFETSIAWQNEGLIYPDIANTMTPIDIFKNGLSFGSFVSAEDNHDNGVYGAPRTLIMTGAGMVKTSAVQSWGVYLPITCADPEATMRFVNEMYKNPDIMNALIYGTEDVSYYLNDAGEACFPEGMSTENVPYRGSDFMYGNFFLCLPSEGYGADFRANAEQVNRTAKVSPYLGFALDTTDLSDAVAALSAVNGQYYKTLNGGLYTESLYNEFRSALNAAGIDDYVAAIQAQVDAWKAAQ